MKKILEILQYGDHDIRFNTDFQVEKDPDCIPEIMVGIATAMTTSLWGGNETSVLAMIRALASADLACSVNRKEMLRFLDQVSGDLQHSMMEARRMMEKSGYQIHIYPPSVKPSSSMS